MVPPPRGFSQAPSIISGDRARPLIDAGVSAGPAGRDSAIVWAHVDRPSQMTIEYATTSSFANPRRISGTVATPATGLTARARIGGLGPGQDIFYRVRFEDLASGRTVSEPASW